MAFDPQTGPPLATAAHARARAARMFAQLRESILLKVTLVMGALALITGVPLLMGHSPLPLYDGFRIAFVISLFLLLVRVIHYLTTETLWLLRNRLILAYVFMGVVPVVLIAGMLAIATYMFYGQYAAFLLVSSLNEHTRNVDAVNRLTVQDLNRHPQRAAEAPGMSRYYASYYFPRGYGGVRTFFFTSNGAPANRDSRRIHSPQPWMHEGFRGLVALPNGYAIASYDVAENGERVLTMYSLNPHTLEALVPSMGKVSLVGWSSQLLPNPDMVSAPRLDGLAAVPPAHSLFDVHITSWAFLPVTDWNTGQQGNILTTINTRPSALDSLLFASLPTTNGQSQNEWPLLMLAAVAFGFLIIEVFALVAGIRLTRTITGAVNDLYVGTEHVNRGDFEHRIPVRTRDQLAALEISFNTMTASIGKLLKEQRQKQRLESELSIAHEVQAQLFPHTPPRAAGLELIGRCLPARVVSGDYYDFGELSPTRLSLTLGDISGKGISAALLMATIVSAVRAYQPGQADRAMGAAGNGEANPYVPPPEADPAHLMQRLNLQLYQSTPPEKYATMFYAVYDDDRRELRYTNAGHLPPALVGAHGIRRLDRGGIVVGLFEQANYEVGVVGVEEGDLLAAWSDGITEPENEYGVEFGEARLLELLELNRTRPLNEIEDAILAAVRQWCGTQEQSDDITLVLARLS